MKAQLERRSIRQCHITDQGMAAPKHKISSEALLGFRGELLIEHKGREYKLRLTQNGKLILTA